MRKSRRALRAGSYHGALPSQEMRPRPGSGPLAGEHCGPPCGCHDKNRAEPPAGDLSCPAPIQGSRPQSRKAVAHDKNPACAPRGAQKKPPYGILKALVVLHKAERPLSPRAFARLMWPDSEGWRRSARCGPKGVSRGGGMNLAAGGLLGKLAKQDLAKCDFLASPPGWVLSEKGKQAVAVLKDFAQVMK